MARTISVEILGDSRDLERAFERSSRSAQKFNRDVNRGSVRAELGLSNLRRQALGLAGGFLAVDTGARLVAAGLKTSIDAASNLNEQISKSEVVFGSASGEVEDWAGTMARSFGIAKDEALEAAGGFGNLFRTVGLGGPAAAEMSRQLVELAADLAAFSNTDPDDALLALRSGLIGEAEPLRRYGVLLSEAKVQQEAMAATGKTNARSLTDQEKAMARYRIILRETVTAQGNFRDTSEGFAQQTKILRAEMRDLSTVVGNLAIPVLTNFVSGLNDGIEDAREFASALRRIKDELPIPQVVEDAVIDNLKDLPLGIAPGVEQVKDLKAAVDEGAEALRNLRGETEQPLSVNVDFSAVNALTAGLMTAGLAAKDLIESRGLGSPKPPPVFTAEQRRGFFDARIARERNRAQDLPLRQQVERLREIEQQIKARIAKTKDITRRLALEDDLLEVQRDIRSTQAQLHANAEAAERDALAHQQEMARLAKERAEAAAEAAETAAFRRLGLGPGGAELAPSARALRRRLGRVEDAVQGTFLDTSKTRALLRTIRSLLVPGVKGVTAEVRDAIERMLADIDRKLDERRRRRPRYRVASTEQILAGLGLSPTEVRLLSNRLAGVDRFGRIPAGGASAFGVRLPGTGSAVNVYGPVTVKADHPDVIARELQKRARRLATQTRGTRPGTRQAIDG